MKVPFLDLKRINAPYKVAFASQWEAFLDSGWYILGEQVQAFETEWASYCQVSYCVGVGNGLDALTLIFRGYIELGRLRKGDAVLVPSNTYIASILALLEAGLTPVLVEPNPHTFNLDPACFPSDLPEVKGVLAVHLYGQLAAVEALQSWCADRQVLLIEDAAQAHGAEQLINQQRIKAGAFGDAAGFSFYPGKNLGALGDAGAITTRDPELYRMVKMLRNYGSGKKYHNAVRGVNSRLDEWQAAVLRIKSADLDQQNQERREIAQAYMSRIKHPDIQLPQQAEHASAHVYHLFVIQVTNRSKWEAYLAEKGIQTLVHYPIAPHQQPALSAYQQLSFPITERLHEQVLSLPLFPGMTSEEINYVIDQLNAAPLD